MAPVSGEMKLPSIQLPGMFEDTAEMIGNDEHRSARGSEESLMLRPSFMVS